MTTREKIYNFLNTLWIEDTNLAWADDEHGQIVIWIEGEDSGPCEECNAIVEALESGELK